MTPLQLAAGSRLAVVLHAASTAPAEMAARLQQVCVLGAPGELPSGPSAGGQTSFASGAAKDGGFGLGSGGSIAAGHAGLFKPAGEGCSGYPAGGSSPSRGLCGGGPTVAEQQASARAAAAAVKEQATMNAATAGDRQAATEMRPQAPHGSMVQGGDPSGSRALATGTEQGPGVRPPADSQSLGFSIPPGSFGTDTGAFGGGRVSPLGLGGMALGNKPLAGPIAPPIGMMSTWFMTLQCCCHTSASARMSEA